MKCEAKTEAELRDFDCPRPKTKEELMQFVDSLLERDHDYGTCVYAMSLAAVAAFYYASHVVGSTGFQAGCAEWDFLTRTRRLKGPAMILDGTNLLYPQYDTLALVAKWMQKSMSWASQEAKQLLLENPKACESVHKHWETLAAMQFPKDTTMTRLTAFWDRLTSTGFGIALMWLAIAALWMTIWYLVMTAI